MPRWARGSSCLPLGQIPRRKVEPRSYVPKWIPIAPTLQRAVGRDFRRDHRLDFDERDLVAEAPKRLEEIRSGHGCSGPAGVGAWPSALDWLVVSGVLRPTTCSSPSRTRPATMVSGRSRLPVTLDRGIDG